MEATVLVIDDDCDDLDLMKEIITSLDPKILCCCYDDPERIVGLISNGLVDFPNYVFIDINMPRMSGLECLVKLREIRDFNDGIIIMYSTSMPVDVSSILMERGANYTFQKPVTLGEYEKILRGIFEASVTDLNR
jgi:DNA-binding NtrC family response regulator